MKLSERQLRSIVNEVISEARMPRSPEELEQLADDATEALSWLQGAVAPYRGVSETKVEDAFDTIDTALSALSSASVMGHPRPRVAKKG